MAMASTQLEETVMLLVQVVDQLAGHASPNHAVGKGDGAVAMTVGTFVRAAEWLGAHVNLGGGSSEVGLRGLHGAGQTRSSPCG